MIAQQQVQRLLAYWYQRTSRERLLVGLALLFLVVAGFYQLYWKPMNASIERLRLAVPEERSQLAQMRIQAKRASRPGASAPDLSLMPTLENALDTQGLRENLLHMEPDGDSLARVSLGQVAYADLLKWILHLQRQYGIDVRSAKLSAVATPGVVDAKLTLAAGS